MSPAEKTRGADVQEHPVLLVLYVLAFATPLLLWQSPPVAATIAGWTGAVALGLLVLRWVMVGFTDFERLVGLRLIRHTPLWRRGGFWLVLFWSTATLGLVTLLAFNHFVDREDAALLELLAPLRVSLVFYVAVAFFAGMLVLVGQHFSILGTTSIMGVTLGVAGLIVVQSVASAFQHEFERRVVGVYAHLNVARSFGFSEYRRLETWLRTLDGVEGASPYVYHSMALSRVGPHEGGRQATVLIKGIDPQTAAQVIDLPQHLERGSDRAIPLTELRSEYPLMPVLDHDDQNLPSVIAETPDPRGADWYTPAIAAWNLDEADDASRAMPTIFIGATLARELSLAEGDVVRLVDPGDGFDVGEPPKFVHYTIAGVFEAGFEEYDKRLIFVHIAELQRFRYRGKDLVSGVDVRLTDREIAPTVGTLIRTALNDPNDPAAPEYVVHEWQELNASLFMTLSKQKNVVLVVLSLVIFVAAFNVLSALWTMVVRRTPEIAILMSMGATGSRVARVFQVTGMVIGVIGSLGGVVLGLVMCALVELYGYTLDPDVYFIEQLPVEVDFGQLAGILLVTLVFCFIATIPPSTRAAQLRPVEGLRYE